MVEIVKRLLVLQLNRRYTNYYLYLLSRIWHTIDDHIPLEGTMKYSKFFSIAVHLTFLCIMFIDIFSTKDNRNFKIGGYKISLIFLCSF